MTYPAWLWTHPVPLTLPAREPFKNQRLQLATGLPFALAAVSANEARHAHVIAELELTGETHYERRLRKRREWGARNKAKKS